MNFNQIISELAEVDSDALGRLDSRRAVFASLGTVAKRSAQAALPVMLASYFQKAYAQSSTSNPVEIFNYALTLELLEADFYAKMIASPLFLTASSADQAAIRQIAKHENSHVSLLQTVIRGINGTPVSGIMFKASTFATLTSFAAQLQVAQLLEDTGVRAYKGRAADLQPLSNVTISGVGSVNPLEAALQIHSVEARHAARIRFMRGQSPWILGNGDLDTQAPYLGATPESNVTQAGFNLTNALGTTYSAADVAAAFDEILTVSETLAIAQPLIQ